MVFPQVHTFKSRAGYRPAQTALPAAVVGVQLAAQLGFQSVHHTPGAGIPGHQRPLGGQRLPIHPAQAQQGHREADVGFRTGFRHQRRQFFPAQAKARPDGNASQPFHGPGNQVTQPEGAGKRKGNQTFFAGRQHLPDTCGKKADGVFRIPPGVEHPLGFSRGAGGGPGDHPAHLRLRSQQERTGILRQHGGSGKGQLCQLGQIVQFFGIFGVDAAPYS